MAQFHFDENTNYDIAVALMARGHDVVTSRDVGLDGHDDDEQLLAAATAGRILVTHNREDFILLHRTWQRWSRAWGATVAHAGILIVPQDKGVPPDMAAREIDVSWPNSPSATP